MAAKNSELSVDSDAETEKDHLIESTQDGPKRKKHHPPSKSTTKTPPLQPIGCPPITRSAIDFVGTSNLVIIILGFIGSLAAIFYILFLWAYSPGCGYDGPDSPLWRRIVLSGWLTTTVTLATVLLRTVTAWQTTFALSVLAALALEDSTAPLRYTPLLLTLRGTGSAPGKSVLNYALQAFKLNPVLIGAILVHMATMLASQFSSALLVSDLAAFPLRNDTQSAAIPYGLNNVDIANVAGEIATEHWKGGGSVYPVFAEYSEPPIDRGDWMFDTGLTLRAFPPFGSTQHRSSLHRYKGYSAVLDSRFSCMMPTVNANATVQPSSKVFIGASSITLINLDGSLTVQMPLHMHQTDSEGVSMNRTLSRSFNCSVAVPKQPDDPSVAAKEWAISICGLERTSPWQYMDSPLNISQSDYQRAAQGYLVINTTGNVVDWDVESTERFNWQHSAMQHSAIQGTPWRRLSHPTANISLTLSYCVTPWGTATTTTTMTGGAVGSEPLLRWDFAQARYDASQVVRLHAGGIEGLSLGARGVLSLAKRTNWSADSVQTTMNPIKAVSFLSDVYNLDAINGFEGDVAAFLCTSCATSDRRGFQAQRTHIALFHEVLRTTGGSLPLAMSTLWTVLAQRAWYDFLPQFDLVEGDEARFAFVGEAVMPVRRLGLNVVVAVVAVHNLVLIGVMVWFLSRLRGTRSTQGLGLVGHLWQGFGQMAAGDFTDLVQRTSTATDEEVAKEIEVQASSGRSGGECVGLVWDDEQGVTRLVRRKRNTTGQY